VLDGFNSSTLATVDLGADPFAIAINGSTNMVFVGLRSSGNLVTVPDKY
jgi:hypothetical protein